MTLNIFSQIGLIMLIGLAAKNGILIVEFANQLRDRGLEFEEALFQASRLRLRPIMMTGLSTAIGAVPLILASGAGAMSRLSHRYGRGVRSYVRLSAHALRRACGLLLPLPRPGVTQGPGEEAGGTSGQVRRGLATRICPEEQLKLEEERLTCRNGPRGPTGPSGCEPGSPFAVDTPPRRL